MELIERYIEHLLRTNRKQVTVDNYRSKIEICLKTLEKYGMDTSIEKIKEDDIWFLIANMNGKEQSIRQCVEALNRCILYNTGIDLMKKMDILWNRPIINRVFIDNCDFQKLYDAADAKERMILLLGAGMGLRRKEIWELKLKDIEEGYMTIRGKGHGKDGLLVRVKIPSIVRNELNRYMVWRSGHSGMDLSGGKLIVFKDNDDNIIEYKNPEAIFQAIGRLSRRSGVNATTHSLRRLFCTELYNNGSDPLVIKQLMRHSSLEMIYVYINQNELKANAELENMTSNLIKL